MRNTLKFSRSVLAILVTIGVIFSVMPGKIVNAANGKGDTYYLFAKLVDEESGTKTAVDAYFGNSATDVHDGCEFLCALYTGYRRDENFVVPGTYRFCLNDAVARYDGNYGSSPDYLLLGSTLVFNDIMVSSKTENTAILGTEVYGDEAYKVIANYMLQHAADTYTYEVGTSQTFNISTKADGTGTVFETDDLTVGGRINIGMNSLNPDKPNVLRIAKNGTLTAGEEKIKGAGNAILEIGAGATVTGGLVLYDVDGVTPFNTFTNTETFRYEGGKWIRNTNEGPFNDFGVFFDYEKEYILGEIEYSVDGREWKSLEGENKDKVNFESLGNAKGFYVRFTLVATPKDDSVILVNGAVPQGRATGTNSRMIYVERNGDTWEGKYEVEFRLGYEQGIYFVNETGSDLSISYGFTKDAQTTAVGQEGIATSALGTNNELFIKLGSSLDHLQAEIRCTTDANDNRDFHAEESDLYFMEKGSGWDKVFIVRVSKQSDGIRFDDLGGKITGFTYKLDSGNTVTFDGNYIAKDIYENSNTITIGYTIPADIVISNVIVKYNGTELISGKHYGFDPDHPESITLNKNGDWGNYYDIEFVTADPQEEMFFIEFPDSSTAISRIDYSTDGQEWHTAGASGNGYKIELAKSNTSVSVKVYRNVEIGAEDNLNATFQSIAQANAEPVEMTGIGFINNEFMLTKPTGANADWAYGYIVTFTSNSNPANELAKYGGYNVRLDGYIGISYYVALDQGIRDSNTKITFTHDSSVPALAKQEVGFDQARYVTVEGRGDYYVFDVKVAPSDMTKTITATLTNKDYTLTFKPFTARDCVNAYTSSSDQKVADLAKAIKNYGYYAQLKFGPAEPIFEADALTLVEPGYEKVTVGTIQDGISYTGSAVVFLSGNKLKHYFTIESNPELYTFKIDGQEVQKVSEGDRLYSITTGELNAAGLNKGLTVEIYYNGTKIKTFVYSPMNYAKSVTVNANTTPEMKNLAKAFAMYYTKVNAYNNAVNQ